MEFCILEQVRVDCIKCSADGDIKQINMILLFLSIIDSIFTCIDSLISLLLHPILQTLQTAQTPPIPQIVLIALLSLTIIAPQIQQTQLQIAQPLSNLQSNLKPRQQNLNSYRKQQSLSYQLYVES